MIRFYFQASRVWFQALSRQDPPGCIGSICTWVGDFHIWGPGIRPNPSESDSLPNPSESGTHFCRVKMPTQTANTAKQITCGAARNPPESIRMRPSTESVRIPNRHPRVNVHRLTKGLWRSNLILSGFSTGFARV